MFAFLQRYAHLGDLFENELGGGGPPSIEVIVDTFANIVVQTPATPTMGFSTDFNQFMVWDGSKWWVDSSYETQQPANNDIGYIQQSNREGYGKTYITDKALANCSIGNNANNTDGSIRYTNGQVGINVNGIWEDLLAAVGGIRQISAENYAVEFEPLSNWLKAFSGDSELLGLNGLPIVQGYHVSMGAYPPPQICSGGTF